MTTSRRDEIADQDLAAATLAVTAATLTVGTSYKCLHRCIRIVPHCACWWLLSPDDDRANCDPRTREKSTKENHRCRYKAILSETTRAGAYSSRYGR